jgi:hypothetical protein
MKASGVPAPTLRIEYNSCGRLSAISGGAVRKLVAFGAACRPRLHTERAGGAKLSNRQAASLNDKGRRTGWSAAYPKAMAIADQGSSYCVNDGSARSAKRVYSDWKASLTVPVGP